MHAVTRTYRYVGLAVVAILAVSAACTRSKDDVQTGGGSTASTASTPASGGGGEAGPGDFGTLKAVCGPAPSGDKNGTPDTKGVTADSIKVGAVSDPGFAGRPGLNQELFDASTVFTKWCNDAGGINGRKLDLTLRDAALTEY